MMTSSNGNIFRVTGPLWGETTGHRWILHTKPVTRSFDVLSDLRLNKQLSKQSWGWWFETPSSPLWRHCNVDTLRPGQDGRHFADDIFKCIFFNKDLSILIKISLKFVLNGPFNHIPPLVQMMSWRRPGSAFIKPDQRNSWIKDQLGNALLSTISHLQLPNFVSCGRDQPSHMTQSLVTVGAKL